MPIDPAPGSVLDGNYVLQSRIGGGRFGAVYRATHIALQKPVAVKVLHAGDRLAASDFEQFRTEAEALGRLAHPNIVGVIDFGVDPRGGGTPYLVMELVEGDTLDQVCVRDGPIDLERAAPWLQHLALALDYAHRLGVAHGDLAPANVILVGTGSDATPKIIDFGLARIAESGRLGAATVPADDPDVERDLNLAARVVGTPEYLAPERLRGEPPSPASDVYAFSALAYRLLAGRAPFEGDTRAVVHAQLTAPPPPVTAFVPGLPAAAVAAVASGLAKRAHDRPQSPGAVAERLTAAARQLALTRWRRHEAPRRVALAAMVAALGVVLASWLTSVDLVRRLEGAAVDARFALMPAGTPDPRLLVVSIDDESLAADPRPLGARGDEFATGLEQAFARGAAVVGLDLLLPESWARAPRFADLVLHRANGLVLGAASVDDTTVIGPEAVDALVAGALGPEATSALFGLVSHEAAPDGVVREARAAVVDRQGRTRPTLAGRVAALAGASGTDTTEPFIVDYAVDARRLSRQGWGDFERLLASGARLDGRVVLVGAEFTGSGDRHVIPGPGRLPAATSGLVLQGLVVNTLLQGRRLQHVGRGWLWAATGALLFGATAALLWVRSAAAALGWAVVALAIAAGAAVAAFRWGLVAALAAPALAWLAASVAAAGLRTRLAPVPR